MMEMSDHPVTKQYFDFADRMPYGGYGDGFGGGAWWIFAILVLFLWGGNGFGNRNGVGPLQPIWALPLQKMRRKLAQV